MLRILIIISVSNCSSFCQIKVSNHYFRLRETIDSIQKYKWIKQENVLPDSDKDEDVIKHVIEFKDCNIITTDSLSIDVYVLREFNERLIILDILTSSVVLRDNQLWLLHPYNNYDEILITVSTKELVLKRIYKNGDISEMVTYYPYLKVLKD